MTGGAGTGARGIGWLAGPSRPRLLLDDTSAVLRHELGPVAWSAFEVLAMSAQLERDGRLTVALNARQLAAVVGVGRDAATKALAVLRDRGLIALEQRRDGGGQFATTRYTVHVQRGEPEIARNRAPRAGSTGQRVTMPTLFDTDAASLNPATHPPKHPSIRHNRDDDHDTTATHPPSRNTTTRLPDQLDALAFRNAIDDGVPDGRSC